MSKFDGSMEAVTNAPAIMTEQDLQEVAKKAAKGVLFFYFRVCALVASYLLVLLACSFFSYILGHIDPIGVFNSDHRDSRPLQSGTRVIVQHGPHAGYHGRVYGYTYKVHCLGARNPFIEVADGQLEVDARSEGD